MSRTCERAATGILLDEEARDYRLLQDPIQDILDPLILQILRADDDRVRGLHSLNQGCDVVVPVLLRFHQLAWEVRNHI